MTREEALEILKNLDGLDVFKDYKRFDEAYQIAIKALEQEPICPSHGIDCEDCPAYDPCEDAELATKTCNKQIVSKLEDAELARDSEETCNNKQVISKLVASEDAISREDALMCLTGEWTELTDELIHRFIRRIKALPPINPKHKVGKWIYHMETWPTSWYRCSICGGEEERTSNYCPNCGAKMEGQA